MPMVMMSLFFFIVFGKLFFFGRGGGWSWILSSLFNLAFFLHGVELWMGALGLYLISQWHRMGFGVSFRAYSFG